MNKRKIIILILVTLVTIAASRWSTLYKADVVEAGMLTDVANLDPSDLGDFPSAADGIKFFQERLKHTPQDAISLAILGQLYLRQARETGDVSGYQQAEAALHKALELLPGYAPANVSLAAVLYNQHNFTDALRLARQIYQEDPRLIEALAITADAYQSLGQYPEAEKAYQELLRQAPTPPVLARLTYQAELQGQPEKALQLMQRAAGETLEAGQSKEEMAWYLTRLGDLYFNTGQIEKAGEHYDAALRVSANYYIALAGSGKARAAQGRYDEAIDFYQRAIAIIPRPDFLAALGDVYTLTGQPDQAQLQYDTVEYIGKLAQINQQVYNRQLANFYSDHDRQLAEALNLAVTELDSRQDIYGYDTAAWAYYKTGKFMQAQEMIKQAMRLGTRDARLYYHAGMIAQAQGHAAQSEQMLAEALAINPHFDLIQAGIAQTALDRLRAR